MARDDLSFTLLHAPTDLSLVDELRDVAAACFDHVPHYQALSGRAEDLACAELALARRADGRLVGFCAARVLEVQGVGKVLHLGLTCVHPSARGLGLTHRLLSRLVTRHLLRHAPLSGFWFSSTASVLSSLGNIAKHFDDVYPSPYRPGAPSAQHTAIATAISRTHRAAMHLPAATPFDAAAFVFRGANAGTLFEKAADDARYHHRDAALTAWYATIADLDAGDAVLQVGRVSVQGYLRYVGRKLLRMPRVPVLPPVVAGGVS